MAAPTEAQLAHQDMVEELDIHSVHKTFRNPSWRPNHRRNKNIKTILLDAQKREASAIATPQTQDDSVDESGASTPASGNNPGPNLAQASQSLSKLVLEKSLRSGGGLVPAGTTTTTAPSVTYTNIESAPSLAHKKHYCDVTGLPALYLDPKTRLRYYDKEVFGLIRGLPQGVAEGYLEARAAHTVLK